MKWLQLPALLVVAAVMLVSLSSCGDSGATVTIEEFKFVPDRVNIKAGQTVTWENEDRRSHQVMSGLPPVMTDEFMSPPLEAGDTWTHMFEKPGEYPYHDMKVPGVTGWVEVEE